MDINTLRGLSTVFMMIAFLGICWWAFSPSRRKKFNDAAQLPFADEGANSSRELNAGKTQSSGANETAPDAPKQD